jgi:hypothetical protein
MPKYFFHLAGQLPAHDLLGHECTNDKEAKDALVLTIWIALQQIYY